MLNNLNLDPTQRFTAKALLQTYLDVEAALALSQAEIGLIPKESAQEIASKSDLRYFDVPALQRDIELSMAPIDALAKALAKQCDTPANAYVHWGATTQNIIFTGRTLLLKETHQDILFLLNKILLKLSEMARCEMDTIVIGRTNLQPALPITLGFKYAAWIAELQRHVKRLTEAAPRTFSLVLGGAIGAMQSFDGKGRALNQAMAKRLELSTLIAPTRTTMDLHIEYFLTLSLLAASCHKIASEINRLSSFEIGELQETLSEQIVGSSTMPQKINPKYAPYAIAMAAKVQHYQTAALDAMQIAHEGESQSSKMHGTLTQQYGIGSVNMLDALMDLLINIKPNHANIQRNLALTNGLMSAEVVMMHLAKSVGKPKAYQSVKKAVQAATADPIQANYIKHLAKDAHIQPLFTFDQLQAYSDYENCLGDCKRITREILESVS